jgi:hypothetical protein
MFLYNVDDKGNLVKLDKLLFRDEDVYLIDDFKIIFIWVGLEVSQKKKDLTAKIARRLDKERGGAAKILIMKQNREYGSFLIIMENLKKGLVPGKTIERRPELILEDPNRNIEKEDEKKMEDSNVIKWLKQLKEHRTLSQVKKETPKVEEPESIPLDLQQTDIEVKEDFIWPTSKEELPETAEEIDLESQIREAAYYLSLEKYDYNELCWLLAERIMKQLKKIPSIEDTKEKAEQVFNSSSTYDELCWLIAEMDILKAHKYFEFKEEFPQ